MPLHALVGLLLFWQGAANHFDVLVVDGSNRPIPGVRVELKTGGAVVASARTDEKGRVEFRDLEAARCELVAAKDGFEPVHESNVELPASVTLTMRPARRRERRSEGRERRRWRRARLGGYRGPGADRQGTSGTAGDAVGRLAAAARSGSRAGRRTGDVGGRRAPERADRELGGRHGSGDGTIRIDGADRQRRDDECLTRRPFWRSTEGSRRDWFRWRRGAAASTGNGN